MARKGKILIMSPNLKGVKGGVNRIQPSLGVGYLAAVLEREGHEVHIRDTALEGHGNEVLLEDGKTIMRGESDAEIAKYVSSLGPDIVGISVLFSNLAEHAHKIAKIVKETDPDIKVVMGGNHITNSARDYIYALTPGNEDSNLGRIFSDMEDRNIDYAMAGECDFQFAELVDALLNKKDPKNIAGLVYRKPGCGTPDANVTVNPNFSDRPDIRRLPHPARHLMNMEGYFKIDLFHSTKSHSERVLNVMAARGCPEKCAFCTTPSTWGNRIRWRDPLDIYEEIVSCVERYGIGEIQFEDDTLTSSKAHIMDLCELMEPLGIPWCTPNGTKVNYYMEHQLEMFRRMAKAGCYQVTFGCESGVQRVLDRIVRKNLRIEQIPRAIDNAKKAGLLVHTFWIVGFPGETRREMEETVEFAARAGADSYSISTFSPLPGTPIYRQVVKENLWWDPEVRTKDMLFRNSLIRVDEFSGPEEFQAWVDEKNAHLNGLLEEKDPERAKWVRESNARRLRHEAKFKYT